MIINLNLKKHIIPIKSYFIVLKKLWVQRSLPLFTIYLFTRLPPEQGARGHVQTRALKRELPGPSQPAGAPSASPAQNFLMATEDWDPVSGTSALCCPSLRGTPRTHTQSLRMPEVTAHASTALGHSADPNVTGRGR